MNAQTWTVNVETKADPMGASTIDMGPALGGDLDGWLTVVIEGDHAMAKSANGSCTVSLCKGPKVVMELYPKGRTPERRKLAMSDVVDKFKGAVRRVEKLAGQTVHDYHEDHGVPNCGICGDPKEAH